MRRLLKYMTASVVIISAFTLGAQADNSLRVRGTVTAVTTDTITVETTAGEIVTSKLTPDFNVVEYIPIKLEDVPQNAFLAIVSAVQPDRSQRALALFVFPETMRGLGEGVRAWDLGPNSRMTNATVAQVVNQADGGREMTVRFGNDRQTQTMQVTPQTLVLTIAVTNKQLLIAGAKVVLFSTRGPDGTITTGLLGVGRDGRIPPV